MSSEPFEQLLDALSADPAVRETQMMGRRCISCEGRIFCGIWEDELIVRLGRDRVDVLVLEERAARFDPSGRGRQMKDWALVHEPVDDWLALAQEGRDATRASSG